MIFFSVWYFAKIINPFVPFSLSCHSSSWVRSYNVFTVSQPVLWHTLVVFKLEGHFHHRSSTLWYDLQRELVKSIILPWTCKFPFTLWIHLCLSGDDIWFSLLWCGDDISLGKGKRMKCLHLSIYIFPPFSISIFLSPSSYPSTSHLPSPSFQLVVKDSPVSYNEDSFKIPSSGSNPVKCNRHLVWTAHILSIRKVGCQRKGERQGRQHVDWKGDGAIHLGENKTS